MVIFVLGLGCGEQETMRTEESLGLGQAVWGRQVQTGSQQAALVGQRIQTGSESEQRQGLPAPPLFSPPLLSFPLPSLPFPSTPTQQDLAVPFCRAHLAVAGQLVPTPASPPTLVKSQAILLRV